MPTKIISFGERYGAPDAGGDDIVIDVRKWLRKNPYHNRKLRYLRGTDSEVQKDVARTPGFHAKYAEILRIAREVPQTVYVGCTGGHHRSVYVAILLGRDIGVPVEHRDIG